MNVVILPNSCTQPSIGLVNIFADPEGGFLVPYYEFYDGLGYTYRLAHVQHEATTLRSCKFRPIIARDTRTNRLHVMINREEYIVENRNLVPGPWPVNYNEINEDDLPNYYKEGFEPAQRNNFALFALRHYCLDGLETVFPQLMGMKEDQVAIFSGTNPVSLTIFNLPTKTALKTSVSFDGLTAAVVCWSGAEIQVITIDLDSF